MAADPLSFVAVPTVAQDISLSLVDKAGVPTIQITDTATSTVLAQKAESDTTQVNITLSNLTDRIRIQNDFTSIVPVTVDGHGGSDVLFGPPTGANFTITGVNAGTGAGASFVNITKVQGANNASNTFVLNAGAALTAGIDGGTGGQNTLIGPSDGATFTVTGADQGRVSETGSASSTIFANVGKLQGSTGADTFVLNAGASLSTGLDGGGGLNTVSGPATGATYTITGSDTGTAAGVAFSHIGKLQGASAAPDQFVLSPGATLSVGIDGGTGGQNTLFGPLTGATFNITARDAGNVGGVAFTNVDLLQGANGAPDTFVFAPGGSLSNRVDGGTGGQNALIGPSDGATFTVTGVNTGQIQETGAAFSTAFVNIGKLQGGAGADTFVLNAGASLSTGIDGGAGANTLRGPADGATYTVTGLDAGTVQEAGSAFVTAFAKVGKLQGADNVSDTFIISPAGALSSGLDGGVDSNDVLRLLGTAVTASYVATGPQSGRYNLDGRQVAFSGIETIDDQVIAQNRVVTGTDGADIITISQAGTSITVSAPTMDQITFQRPSVSLTVNGGGGFDSIAVISNLALPSAALRLSSETITVVGETIDTTGATNGSITFDSLGLVTTAAGTVNGVASGALSATTALITVSGSTLRAGGFIALTAAANYTGGLTGQAVSAFGLAELATILISGSSFAANGLVNVAATTSADVTVRATGSGAGSANADAAIATTLLNATSILSVVGSTIQSSGSIALLSGSTIRSTTTADATGAGAGGAAANTIGVINDTATLGGTDQLNAGGGSTVSVATNSSVNVATQALASSGGVSGSTPRTAKLLSDSNAATTEGAVTAAAAVATNAITGSDTTSLGGTITVSAPAGLAVASSDTHVVTAGADSSATSTSNGIAAAVAINAVNEASTATVTGGLTYAGSQVAVQAAENSTVTATATSGVGSAQRTGLAGALAINTVSAKPTASIGANAQLALNGASLQVSATITSLSETDTGAAVGAGGAAVGVGASVSLNFTNNDLAVTVEGQIIGAGQVALSGTGQDALITSAKAGSAGGTAVTPVLALSSSDNDSTVVLKAGPSLTTTGSVSVTADRTQTTTTTADASTTAATAGIGAALALSFGFQDTLARIERNVTAASVTVSSRFRSDGTSNAIAGARGVDRSNSRSNTQGQLAHELSFENATTGRTATQPDTQTSAGAFGLSAALAFNSQNGSVTANIAPGATVRSVADGVTVEALSDFDSSATADASLVKSAPSVGIGAAAAINSLSPVTTAEIDGTVIATTGVTVRTGQATDASSPGVDTIAAKAIAGAGGNTVGVAGALGLNVLNLASRALIAGGANVTGGTQALSVSAAEKTDTTTIATADGSSGAGGSGVGIGAGVALTLASNEVTARIDGGAAITTGDGGLSLSASGDHAVHGQAHAGGTAGSVGVAPSTFIAISKNNTLAELGAPPLGGSGLSLRGPVTLTAAHSSSIDGVASSAGSGSSAGIGLSFTLAIVEDTAKALFSRSLTTTGPGADVIGRASDLVDVTLSSIASSAGVPVNGNATSDGQIGNELSFANAEKGGTPATARNAEVPNASGNAQEVGAAGAISLSIANSQSLARLNAGNSITTPGSVTIEAIGDADSRVKADASTVDNTRPQVGVGVAVAMNLANHTTIATVDGTVTSAGLAIHALAPSAPNESHSDLLATAISGTGAQNVGVAGAFAANFANMKSRALLNVGAIETPAGSVDIRSQLLTRPEAVASSSTAAASGGDGNGGPVGVGLSVALNILGNESTAAIPDGVTLTGGRDVTISAQGENLTKTWAISGSSQNGVGITPALALLIAEDHTTATLGTGSPLSITGALTLSVQQKVTGDTKSDAGLKGASDVGVGAAVALNIVEDTADASPSRLVTTGSDVTVSADLVSDVQAASIASTKGVSRNGGPSTTDGQVSSATSFANHESGASTVAPQVAKANGGSGAEQSVGVAAALALNVINGHARATLPAAITVNSGRGVAVLSAMDVDGIATADASTVQQATGIGVAVALNVITADNTALLISPTTANGAITVKAAMSGNGDGVDTFVALANSGAGASKIGVAGAVTLDILNVPTRAQILTSVNAGGGVVTVDAENKSDSTAVAASSATVRGQSAGGGGVGVGASFALSILNLPALAEVPDNILINNANGLTITALGDHKAVTTADAGSASDVSISPAVAIHIAGSDTTARLGAGTLLTTGGTGNVLVQATHTGDYHAAADAQAGGANVGVGAAIALGIVIEHAGASILRDVNAGGDVRVRASNAMASEADATGGAKGNSSTANIADVDAQNTLNNNSNIASDSKIAGLPGGQIALPKAADSVNNASDTVAGQAAGRGASKVGVGAAIGIDFVTTDATATIPAGRSITSRTGQVEVASALQVDGTATAIGTAILDVFKDTSVGAGVALNVVNATNAATIGDNATISAATGVNVTATMAAHNGDASNDFVVQSAAAGGAQTYGIAGSVSVDVVTYDTQASLGQSDDIRGGSGAVVLSAQADFTTQNLAGSGALGADAGVAGSVLVQTSTIGTTSIVGQNSQVDGAAGVRATSEMSYVPRADNFKGLGFALSSGAFGGAGADGGTAIGGSVAVNVLNFNTESHLDTGVRVNQRAGATGSVVVDAASSVGLFSGTGGVGASAGNLGIGIGIDVTIVNQKTLALVADRTLVSTAGDVSVEAHSSDQQTSIAGSFGLANDNAGAGSIVVNLFNLGSDPLSATRAIIGTDVVVASGGKVSVVATNPRDGSGQIVPDSLRLVAGSVGGAGGTAVGIGVAIATRNDLFVASVGDRTRISEGGGLAVGAAGGLSLTMVAAAGAGGLENGAAGSLTVSTLTETATATIGQNVTVTGTTTAADVKVTAEDRTTIVKVAGAANFGSDLAIGAGLDVGVLTKNTIASIGAHSLVSTPGSVEVRAFSKEKINAFAASGGASSELAIAGSVGVQVDTITTRAFIEGTTTGPATQVIAGDNVVVEASAENEMDLFAGGLGLSGSTAIGASAPIPVINKTTEAFIGQNAVVVGLGNGATSNVRSGGFTVTYTDPPATGPQEATTPLTGSFSFSLNGNVTSTSGGANPSAGDPNAGKERNVSASTVNLHGVAVSATNYDDIGLVAISGGASGSVAVNVTGVVDVSNITTSGRIEKGVSVNAAAGASADQSVLVVGSNDYRSLTVSVGASVAGSAAIAPAVAVDAINLTAEALIAGTATVNAANSVGVKARSGADLQTVVASVGIAGSAGISGSPSILVLNDHTRARIGDVTPGLPDVAATVRAGGSVVVQALDDTSILDVDGSVGIGGDAGAGVGLAINLVSKDTTARIAAGSTVDAGAASGAAGVAGLGGVDGRFGNTGSWSGLLVLAGSKEDISSIAIAGGVGGDVGGAGAVNLNIINSNTAATIGDNARINQLVPGASGQDVRIAASNEVSAVAVTGGLGGGTAGLAGAIGVGIVHNGTEASIGSGVVMTAARDVSVEAQSHQDIVAVDVSGGIGAFAGAISFGIWVLGGDYNTGGGSASESSWASDYQNTLTGAALGGFSGLLNGNRPIAFASGDVHGKSIDLHTSTLRTGDAVVYHANGGSVGNLTDGNTYFLIKTGPTTYALAATAADADAGRAITLGKPAGSLELADDSRAQSGLQQARSAIVAAQPTNRLSDSLGAGTAQNGTVALVKAGSIITSGGGMDVTATDGLTFVQVAGQIAAGGTSIGGAFATVIHNNTVLAQVGDNVAIAANGTGLDVEAHSSEHVVQVAAGGGFGGGATILGSGTVTILNETTNASLGKNVRVTGVINSAANPDVKVIANDDTTVTDVAGAIGFGGGAAVGVGADVIVLSKNTLATIDQNAQITTQGSVELRANTTEDVVSVAAVGTASGSAAVNLSASVVIANITTQAFVAASPTTVIDADGNVVLEAVSTSEYDLWGIAAQFAGAAAIGASAAVPVVTKNVLAEIGDGATVTGRGLRNATTVHDGTFGEFIDTSPMHVTSDQAGGGNLGLGSPSYDNTDQTGGNNTGLNSAGNQRQNYDANQTYAGDGLAGQRKASPVAQTGFRGVAVTATNSDDIGSTGISIGAAGAAAVSLSGAVQVVNATVQARIGKNVDVNTLGTSASQSVLVGAGEDFRSLNVAAGLSIAGVAAVTPVASVQIVNLNTSAIVDANAVVDAGDSVVVHAAADEQFTAAAAAGAAAVFAGVSVTPNVMVLDSQTTASIGGSGQATVVAGGSVGVIAEDDSRFIDIAAAFGGGFAGLGIGGNVLIVTKHTAALVTDGSSVTANAGGSQIGNVLDNLGSQAQGYAVQDRPGTVPGVVVQATSREDMTAIAASLGAGVAGIGLAGDIMVIDSDAIAHIGDNATVNSGGSVIVGAANTFDAFTLAGGLGIGLAGAGGGVTVGIVRNGVEASIGDGATVNSGGSTEVIALSRKDVDSFDIAGGLGAIALAGSVGIWTFGGAFSTDYSYQEHNGNGDPGATQSSDALGGKASGWNNKFDSAANGSNAPGGNYNSILNGQTGGNGGNTSRIAAADQSAKPTVGAAKPKTSITAQFSNAAGDIEGTTARIGVGATVTAAGSVIVRAKDATTMTQTAGSFSGGVISVGAPISIVTLNMPVQAIIDNNATVSAGNFFVGLGDIVVEASQTTAFHGFVFAGSGGLATLGAQILIVNDNTDQAAWVKSGTTLTAIGNIGINATSSQSYSGGALGATLNAVGAGASVAMVNVNGGTHALMDGNTQFALGSMSVVAMADTEVSLQTYGVGLALVGGGNGAIAVSHIGKSSEARISDGSSTTVLGDVTVSAVDLATADLASYAIQIAGGLGIGIAVAAATIDPSVTAHAGGSYALGGTLSAVAEFNTDGNGNKIPNRGARTEAFSVGAALGAGIAGAVSISDIRPTVLAQLDDGAHVDSIAPGLFTPNVVVRSLSGSDAVAAAQGIGAGLIGGLGASVALATVGGSNRALATGQGLSIGSSSDRIGALTVDARSADDASAESFAASGGILLGAFAINLANATVDTSVLAQLGLGAGIFVDNVTVNAGEGGHSHALSQGIAIGGEGVAGAASVANATHNVPVDATVDGSTVDALNGLTILATTSKANADARAVATGAALLAGITVNSATANSTGHTFAVLQNAQVLTSGTGAILIHAEGHSDANSAAIGTAIGIAGVGSTHATTLNNHGTEARIGAGVQIGTPFQGDFEGFPVGSVEVSALSVGTGLVNVSGASGGIVTVPDILGKIDVTPFAHAYVQDNAQLIANGSVTVSASNYAEGDGTLSGKTISAIDFGSMELDHDVKQTAEAIVSGGVQISANGVSVTAKGGDPALTPAGYDGISTALGNGFSVGIIGHSNGEATANLTSTVRALILNGTTQNPTGIGGGNNPIVVSADTLTASAKAVTDDSGGGAIELTTTTADAFVNATTEAIIGYTDQDHGANTANVGTEGDVGVHASANLSADATSKDNGGGLASFNSSDAQARTSYSTLAGFGQGVGVFANNVNVSANTTHHEITHIDNQSHGGIAGSTAGDTNSGSFASPGSTSGIVVGADTHVWATGALNLQAAIVNSSLEAFSVSNAQDGAGITSATATAIGDDQVKITLSSGSDIRGDDGVVINGAVTNYLVRTDARGKADISVHANSFSNNYANVTITVDAQAGAKVEAGRHTNTGAVALEVDNSLNVIRQAFANTDGPGITATDHYNGRDRTDLPGKHDDRSGDHSKATINWNADVTLERVAPEKQLVIDASGVVTEADGISVDGFPFSFFIPPDIFGVVSAIGHQTGPIIHVGDITSEEVNTAEFRSTKNNIIIFPDGSNPAEAPNENIRNVITGNQGTWLIGEGAGVISIVNNSQNTLEINNIETIPQSTDTLSRVVSIDVPDAAGFKFAIRPFYAGGFDASSITPSVQISNHTIFTGGDILLNGVIDNPVGATFIDSGAGSILQENPNAVVRTLNLTMNASKDIGQAGIAAGEFSQAAVPVEVELVQSPGRVPLVSIFGFGDVVLDVTTRLRDPSLTSATVNFRELIAGDPNDPNHYKIQVTFHDARLDTALDFLLPAFAPAGIVVGAMSSPINDAAGATPISTNQFYKSVYYPDTFGPLSTDVISAFGFNTFGGLNFTAPATYNIGFAKTNLGQGGFLIAADADVTINQLPGPAPFALLGGSVGAPIVVSPTTAASLNSGVSIAPPAALTAIETPLSALTTYFGVTETDLTSMAAAASDSPLTDVLSQDFVNVDPSLPRSSRVTKPSINWH